ncbi:amidohydrolase family protein [Patescibacteria group bacterium]|nr:amidohydrolase family protein [Patescibacteria group bacterium]
MYDILITNATIVDGTGRKRYKGDVGIKKEIIVEIGELSGKSAHKTIDAKGLIVAPGFVDILNHSDSYLTLLKSPKLSSLAAQGITTILVGHCGSSLAPLVSANVEKAMNRWAQLFRNVILPPKQSDTALKSVRKWADTTGVNINWVTVADYLSELKKMGMGVNVATLIGHSTIRRTLVQDEQRELSRDELDHLKQLVADSMQDGAHGLSFGLQYTHAYYVQKKELVELAQVTREYGGKCYFHLRDEEQGVAESVREVIDIAKQAEVGVEIVHMQTREKFSSEFESALNEIEHASNEGVEINFDFFPYKTSWTVLYTCLPEWAYRGSREDLLRRLSEKKSYDKIAEELSETDKPFDDFVVSYAPYNKAYVGRRIGDIAQIRGIPVENSVLDVLKACKGHVICFEPKKTEKIIEESIEDPLSIVASGGAGYDQAIVHEGQLVHPRCFGTFPRFIRKYVRESELLTLERAIQKITSIPALKIGFFDRGFIHESMKADIVIFDYKKIRDRATLRNPFLYPEGIKDVIVNGTFVVEEGSLTNNRPGAVLKK